MKENTASRNMMYCLSKIKYVSQSDACLYIHFYDVFIKNSVLIVFVINGTSFMINKLPES